ncbi:MAG: DUF2178 domain-containing protein [Thermoplasmata archaeon]|nr:DUF2178 domain-containing protein [Thermoplasmata archaeon]
MNRKQFIIYAAILNAIVGGIAGYAVAEENAILLLFAIIIGMIFMYAGKRNVDEVIEDERILSIGEKASRRVMQIFGIGMAIAGTILIAMDKHAEAGYALSIAACMMIMLYIILYAYYNRKGIE